MFRKILGLLILGLVLASCGTPVPTGGLKDVGATSAAGGVTVKWTFDGDKTKIKGFRIFRNAGGNGTSYTKLADVLNVNAINYSDTVEQGESFKYGVAVINTDNTVGSTLNQTGVAVGPNPVTGTGSMNGKWTMDSKITEAPADKQDEIGREFFFILDITETSGVLSGTLDFRIPDSDPPAPNPDLSFGEEKIEGTKNTDGTYTFKMIEVSEDPATTDIFEEKSWTITTTSVTSTSFTGTYTNVFGFKGTVSGTKIP